MACGCRSQATVSGAGSADAERDHLQRGHYLQVGGVMSFDRGQVTYIFPQRGHINAWAHDSPGLARSPRRPARRDLGDSDR